MQQLNCYNTVIVQMCKFWFSLKTMVDTRTHIYYNIIQPPNVFSCWFHFSTFDEFRFQTNVFLGFNYHKEDV